MKRILAFIQKNKAVFSCFAGAFLLDVVIELMYRGSLSAFWGFVSARPLAFLQNILILTLTVSVCIFTKRKWFFGVLLGSGWAALGVTNMLLLGYRISPLSAIDFSILQLDWSFIGIYASVWTIAAVILAIILLLVGLVLLFLKCPKSPVYPLRGVIALCVLALTVFILPDLPLQSGFAGNSYKDVINLTEQYGFVYSFSRSVVDRGIDRPEDYSARRVGAIVGELQAEEECEPEESPNVVFVQLESFFDVNRLKDVAFSENPLPYFTKLKESCPGGLFTAPSIGAGTANTEFEVLTQMDVYMFGTGEYPYMTILQENTCESLAYILKDRGYAAHAIHNNTATFYDRNRAYPNFGFDTFTSLEYMGDVEYTEIGWAKDKVLKGCIEDALNSTKERDFVFAISVQGHGPAPEDGEDTKIKVLSGVQDAELHGELEYYVTQLFEMDAFIYDLTRYLEDFDEPTVLVLYGDHMPALNLEESMLDSGDLYSTDYVIWANYDLGVEPEKKNLQAYQLASRAFEILGMNYGTLTKFHQINPWSGAYETELNTLQYDMLYGDRIVYNGENPFKPASLRFGTKEIYMKEAAFKMDTLIVRGENFTPYSVICLNGEPQETEFISETEIACACKKLPKDARVSVKQIAEDGTVLSAAVKDQ